ncbi:hypothetical protein F9C11_38105 [Amycolatopsis sp. VS8301801F10]|uniref:hypothetical protein n=1 Tax=Amycolatopsis sp. VS8301801F10 TaxID=2652442 RepID=UPI0038FCFDD8
MSGNRPELRRTLSVWQAVALMAPSMAANINPQQTAADQHAGSVYALVGATLGPRAGVVAGIGLLGTYTFYAVVTSAPGFARRVGERLAEGDR